MARSGTRICADRPTFGYGSATRTGTTGHWQARDEHDQYFGLGDKTGPLDKHGRRLRTRQLDALGYNGESSRPALQALAVLHRPARGHRRQLRHVLRHAGRVHLRLRPGVRQLPRLLPRHRDRRRRPRPLRLRRPRRAQRAGPLRGADRRHRDAAALDAGLCQHRDGAGRRTRRRRSASATSWPRRRRCDFPLSSFPLRLGLHQPRQAPLRVHLEPRQVSPSRRRCSSASAMRACARWPTSSPACSTTTRRSRRSQRRAASCARPKAALCLDPFWDGWGAHLDFTPRERSRLVAGRPAARRCSSMGFDAGWNDNNEYPIWNEAGVTQAQGAHAADPPLAAAARAADDAGHRRARSARARPSERIYTITRAGPPGHPALRADLVGRQHHQLAHAALEPAHGADDEPVGHVQHRPRHRRLLRPGARCRTADRAGRRPAASCRA